VYDTAIAINTDRVRLAVEDTPISTVDVFTLNDLYPSGVTTSTEERQAEMDWDTLDFDTADMLPRTPESNLLFFRDSTSKGTHNRSLLSNFDDSHSTDNFHVILDTENNPLMKSPWPAWTAADDQLAALSGPRSLTERPSSDFLARLPIPDPVAQFTATMLMQMLLAFPQMMLRRETLPPFIHGHWYRPSSATDLALPEPLVNCIGIAQVFASHNHESKPFLWRTVKMEQRSFIEKV